MMKDKTCCKKLAYILILIGAINWGLIGIGSLIFNRNWNVIDLILGRASWLEAIIYILIGIAAIGFIFYCPKSSECSTSDEKKEVNKVDNVVKEVKEFGEKVGDKIEDVVGDVKEDINKIVD